MSACLGLATASLLVIAGAAKIVSPGQLARALKEVPFGGMVTTGTVRGLAFGEVATAVLLIVPGMRSVGAALAGLLGLCFAGVGIAGWLRRATTACGCFGTGRGRPLGPVNVAFGLFVIAAAVVNAGAPKIADPSRYFRVSVIGVSALTLALCLWTHRRLVRELTRPLPSSR
ncbi:MauE/DoxX family redox-associated membrane protein [Actinoallomurus iriomotensis]|uniref:MauE/DoxX family redox-associated membrane protein n=1 Tax=Actinoallomurus iriomotensis TaxID=478107 RepID=UPI002552C753|nr:MauE/DoxX family redox-associated membrane protein [Actinoallomurus iriomotensis]